MRSKFFFGNDYYIYMCFKHYEKNHYSLNLDLLAPLNWSCLLYPKRRELVEKLNN